MTLRLQAAPDTPGVTSPRGPSQKTAVVLRQRKAIPAADLNISSVLPWLLCF